MTQLTPVLLAGAGGFIGSAARYLVGTWLTTATQQRFPLATFTVNVVGCLLIGVVAGLAARQSGAPVWLTPNAATFLMVGFLGGFTTYSAFGNETFQLLKRGDGLVAVGYVAATLVVGVLAVWLGQRLVQSAP